MCNNYFKIKNKFKNIQKQIINKLEELLDNNMNSFRIYKLIFNVLNFLFKITIYDKTQHILY